jgi:pimeloyl-ACP methyl ester carboxylesterase
MPTGPGYLDDRLTFQSDLQTSFGASLSSYSQSNALITAGSAIGDSRTSSSTLALATPTVDNASTVDNAGNSFDAALNIGSLNHIQTTHYTDWVGIADSTDYYVLNLVGQSNLALNLSESSANVSLELIDRNGSVVRSSNLPDIASETINLSGVQAGQYYIRVSSLQVDTQYNLSLLTEYTRVDGTVQSRGLFPWQVETESINIRIPDGALRQRIENTETWVVIHGHRSAPDGFIGELTRAIEQKHQVLVLDWSEPADNPFVRPDLSARWIHQVAEFAAQTMSNIWGLTTTNINLIGHSLGSYVASEIGSIFTGAQHQNPQVNQIIALDPATWLTDAGYDIDGSKSGFQAAADFYAVSTFSRAFWGKGNPFSGGEGLGSARYAHSADEAYRIEFAASDDAIANHNNIVRLFTNLISNPANPISPSFQLNPTEPTYWQAFDGDEGLLNVDIQNQLISFSDTQLTFY